MYTSKADSKVYISVIFRACGATLSSSLVSIYSTFSCIFLLALVICSIFACCGAETDRLHGKVIICNDFLESSRNEFDIERVDLNLCTHLIIKDFSWNTREDPWRSEDRDNVYAKITSLRDKYPHLKEFKRRFMAKYLLLTLTFDTNNVEHTKEIVDDFYDHNLSNYVDFIQIKNLNVIDNLIKLNVQPEKIVWQLLLQGHEKLSNENISFKIENLKDFNDICSTLSMDEWERSYDGNECIAKKKYISQSISWIIKFDCSRSIANKVKSAVRRNLAGISITNLSNDDFHGKCTNEHDTFADFYLNEEPPRRNSNEFFALQTVYEATYLSFNEMDQNSKEIKRRFDKTYIEIESN
ncbi:probable chitinase 2 [Contarinia nasturtii]|uniref:probable chitinase 2 n=1 Tax=Contarinia nasturtii TaxID=265458 RepID=UPI0012D3B5F7|nr:probable chitinase 2 [Contarinia nasturtii]